MNTIQQLRKAVVLPALYRVKLPAAERKRLLRGAIAEYTLRNRMRDITPSVEMMEVVEKPKHTGFTSWNSDKQRIVRCVKVFGPITSRDVAQILSLKNRLVQKNISNLMTSGYLENHGVKENLGGTPLRTVVVTPAGIIYGDKR